MHKAQWLDGLPSSWAAAPAWSVFGDRGERSATDAVHLTPSQSYGVLPQAEYMDMTGNRVVLNLTGQDTMKAVRKGDFIIHLRSFQGGLEGSSLDGKVSAAYTVLKPAGDLNSSYFQYLLKSKAFVDELANLTFQLRDGQTVNYARFARMALPVPPLHTQQRIADYLDRETGQIDAMIAKMDQLAEQLEVRKDAVVSTAVSRGLDKSATFANTSVPGASVIPAHWDVVPLQLVFSFQEGPGILAVDFRDTGVPLLRISSVREATATLDGCNYLDPEMVARRWSHFQVDPGDLLISSSASMGSVSEVGAEVAGSVPYTGIIRIKPGLMIKAFIRWFVVSREFLEQVDLLKTGSTIQHYGPSHLSLMRVALPPEDEQQRIADYLDQVTSRIDKMLAKVAELKSLLTERRAALITEVVTGRKEVA